MGKVVQFILEKRALAFAFYVCAAVALGLLMVMNHRFGDDFGMYWRVANEPLSMAYLPYDDLPFPYLPTMILWAAPLAFLPLWPSYLLFVAISAGALVLVCRRYLPSLAITLALVSPPFAFSYLTGQVTVALTAVLIWACGTCNRVAAGISFALIASMKPQLVIMAPFLMLFRKEWRALGASIATFGLIVAASLLAFGIDTWFVWFASLDDFRHLFRGWATFNFAVTPAALADSFNLPPIPALVAGAAAGIWLVFRCRDESPLVQSAAVGCGSLLAAPYALVHDLAVVVPFLAWSVVQGRFTAAVAISGAVHPLPLILTAYGLVKETDPNAPRASDEGGQSTRPNADVAGSTT